MTAYEIANMLNDGDKLDDRKFAEIFALLEKMQTGRKIPQIYDQQSMILGMNPDNICKILNIILNEIQELVRTGE